MNKISGYVHNLTNGNYFPSFYCLLGINQNYKFLLKYLNKNSRILEIGPGNGSFIDYLLINDIKNITCVDLDDENVKSLQYKYKKIKSINILYGDGLEFLDKNGNDLYDMIISRQVLEHFNPDDVPTYFRLCHSCLKKGGLLITETINASNIFYGCFYRYDDSTHKNSFSEKSIRQYAGVYFKHKFYEHNEIFLRNLFLNKFKHKYNKIDGLIQIKSQEKEYMKNSKIFLIKKIYHFLRYKYYLNKSKRISKRYLGNGNDGVFSNYIIDVSTKI